MFISLLVAFSYPLQCLPSRASATTLWASCDDACAKSKLPAQTHRKSKPGAYSAVAADEEDQGGSSKEPETEPELGIHNGISRSASPDGVQDQIHDGDDGTSDSEHELVALTGNETVADVHAALQADKSARCRHITLTTVFLVGTLTVISASPDYQHTSCRSTEQ